MIATVIPFFLLASVPQETTWQHGPEYNFGSFAEVQMTGINGTRIYGLNVTNSLVCRPKTEDTFKCRFEHIKMIFYELRPETDEMRSNEEHFPKLDEFKPFVFEVVFDNKGVRKIMVNDSVAKDARSSVAKSVVGLLNTGVDLSTLRKGVLMEEVNESNNFLLGECMATIKFGFSSVSEAAMEGQWNLDLSSSMEKLAGRSFSVKKNWNMENCTRYEKFFWALLMVDDIIIEGRMKNVKNEGDMSVHRDTFKSSTYQHWESKIHDKTVKLTESNSLTLDDIHAAGEEWPEITHPVMIVFDDNKITN